MSTPVEEPLGDTYEEGPNGASTRKPVPASFEVFYLLGETGLAVPVDRSVDAVCAFVKSAKCLKDFSGLLVVHLRPRL
jgi:hypothetical protein